MDLENGFVVDGKYRIVKFLGKGGFSKVYLARNLAVNSDVAIKIYANLDQFGVESFKSEFNTVKGLNHKHLLGTDHFGIMEQGRPYLVMQYCPYGTLTQFLTLQNHTFSERELAEILYQVSDGLSFLHYNRITHADIKPDNILLKNKHPLELLISDFGVSQRTRSTLAKSIAGPGKNNVGFSQSYAPGGAERYAIRPEAPRDIFSLGVMMYELAKKELPSVDTGVQVLRGLKIESIPSYSKEFNLILRSCLRKNPLKRPTASDLQEYAIHYLKTGVWPQSKINNGQKNLQIIGGAVFFLIMVIGILWLTTRSSSTSESPSDSSLIVNSIGNNPENNPQSVQRNSSFLNENASESDAVRLEGIPPSSYPAGANFCFPVSQSSGNVVASSQTGRKWMDRNLGAARQAKGVSDKMSFGDLYQWGRFSDGHQCRKSDVYGQPVSSVSSNNRKWQSSFVLGSEMPYNWFTGTSNQLWQSLEGLNNPCPATFKVPSEAEWRAEINSWSQVNAQGAFGSDLKLPLAGYRNNFDGNIEFEGLLGVYWSQTVKDDLVRTLVIGKSQVTIESNFRSEGNSVRCIKARR